MASDPLISIIVPVYNTEEYLEECVRSLTGQRYENLELLLIDDGSADGSGALCDALAAEDERIRVFHQANAGVSSARNRGLEAARGEYICFADSDDWVSKDLLSGYMRLLRTGGVRMAGCGYAQESGEEEILISFPKTDGPVRACDFLAAALSSPEGFFLSVCNWIFSRDLIGEERFSADLQFGEDSLFLCQALKKAETVVFDGTARYFYRIGRHGNTFTNDSADKHGQMIRSFSEIRSLFRGENELLDAALTKILLDRCLTAARAYTAEGNERQAARCKAQARSHYKALRHNPKAGRKDKFLLWFATR